MGEAIGAMLPVAIGVAISPVPIIAIVLVLGTPRARTNGPAFALGWVAGLTIVGGVLLAVASGRSEPDGGDPATWVSAVKLAVGVLFLLLAVRTWRRRPRGGRPVETPRWLRAVDAFGSGRSFSLGALLVGLNPKNLALTVAAVVAIAEAGAAGGEEAVALAVFIAVGSLSILTPIGIYFLAEARAAAILEGLKNWLAAHNAAIVAVLLLVIGAKLAGDAIAALV